MEDFDFGEKATPMRGPVVYANLPDYFVTVEESEKSERWVQELQKRFKLQVPLNPMGRGTYTLCGDTTAFSEVCDCDET